METPFTIDALENIPLGEEDLSDAFIRDNRNNPNNLSFWYPKILGCGFLTPKTKIIHLSDKEINSLFAETPDQVKTRQEFLEKKLLPAVNAFDGPVFLKNGCVSDKFSAPSCLPKDKSAEAIMNSLERITELDLIHDICGLSEFVIRERIEAPEGSPKIYGGLPLRTEIRLFYDFTKHKVLYSVNYWDRGYVLEHLNKLDAYTFEMAWPKMEEQYRKYAPVVQSMAHKHFAKVTGLEGIWSADFLIDEESRIWLIDMAIGRQSAYYDLTKCLMIDLEEDYWNYLQKVDAAEAPALLLSAPLGEIAANTRKVDTLWSEIRFPAFLRLCGISREELIAACFSEDDKIVRNAPAILTELVAVKKFIENKLSPDE